VRIASLVPSTTEIVAALGCGDQLVARTHECDYPPEIAAVPAVTRDLLPAGLTAAEIDAAVAASVHDAHTIYALDADALRAQRPDVVLTQSTCAVCAVDRATVDAACSLGGAEVVSYDPRTLADILTGISDVAAAIGAAAAGERLVASMRARLGRVRERTAGVPRPRVAVVEWPDPVYAPGHWVPDQVEAAGGQNVFGDPGGSSVPSSVDELVAARPDLVVIACCGWDLPTNRRVLEQLSELSTWRAVFDASRVVAVDGSAHTSRPGPRVVDGVEVLARHLADVRAAPAVH
jgi:iron complex transport system substrate-binding protein